MLAGGDLPLDRLAAWARSATRIYAADGAADRLLAAGVRPHVVVGDLDSLRATVVELEGIEVVASTDQESSDADKLLALLAGRGYLSATLVGLEGDRLDHMLGALGAAAASPLELSLGLRAGWGRIFRPGVSLFDFPAGTTVSVMPLGECAEFSISGVEWPLEGVNLRLGGQVSLSNRALGGPMRVEMTSGTAVFVAGTTPEPHW